MNFYEKTMRINNIPLKDTHVINSGSTNIHYIFIHYLSLIFGRYMQIISCIIKNLEWILYFGCFKILIDSILTDLTFYNYIFYVF